jgi:hypothetical protein
MLPARNKGQMVIEGFVLTSHSGDQIKNNRRARRVARRGKGEMHKGFRGV